MTAGPGLQQLHSSSPGGSDSTALLPRLLHPSPTAPRSCASPVPRVSACNPVCLSVPVCLCTCLSHVSGVRWGWWVSQCLSLCVSPVGHVFICVCLSPSPSLCAFLPISRSVIPLHTEVSPSSLVPVNPCLSGSLHVSLCLSRSVSPPPSVPLLQWNIDQPGLLCLASSQNICL